MSQETVRLPVHKNGSVVAHALIDKIDEEWCKGFVNRFGEWVEYRWLLHATGYACRRERRHERPKGALGVVYLQRHVLRMGRDDPRVADHISSNGDYDPLDCRRENLRPIDKSLNDFSKIQRHEAAIKNVKVLEE